MLKFESLPVDAPLRITSPYGRRKSPAPGASSYHKGIDMGRDFSKPKTHILAAADGVITQNHWHDISGWVVMIKHDARWSTKYIHLAAASPLKVGTRVKAGQVIGTMGNSSKKIKGMGVHLHMELHDYGTPVDFEAALRAAGKEKDLTRQETAALIKEMIAAERTKNEPAAGWATSDIAEAKRAGITDGTRPTAPVTRQEVVVMIMRAIRHLRGKRI